MAEATVKVRVQSDGPEKEGRILLLPEFAPSQQPIIMDVELDKEREYSNLAPGDYKVLAFDSLDAIEYNNPDFWPDTHQGSAGHAVCPRNLYGHSRAGPHRRMIQSAPIDLVLFPLPGHAGPAAKHCAAGCIRRLSHQRNSRGFTYRPALAANARSHRYDSQARYFYHDRTAGDGRFLFSGLAPGKYTLTAQRRGYLVQSFNQHDQFATSIVVGPGLASDNLVFRLTVESAVSGTVIDEQGDPVRDARIILCQSAVNDGSRGMRQRAITLTDDEGFYRFAHLQQGNVLCRRWSRSPGTRNMQILETQRR